MVSIETISGFLGWDWPQEMPSHRIASPRLAVARRTTPGAARPRRRARSHEMTDRVIGHFDTAPLPNAAAGQHYESTIGVFHKGPSVPPFYHAGRRNDQSF